jgi:rubredoxin-NAD+ reductase
VDGQGDALRITLDDGDVLTADLVLSATGLRPNCALAQATGIKTNCGIVVDRHLQTTAPDVYALGDCAEVEGLVLPYIMPITHAARALAATLAGKPTPLPIRPCPCSSKHTRARP